MVDNWCGFSSGSVHNILNHVIDYADNRVVIQTMMLDVVVDKWRKMSDHTLEISKCMVNHMMDYYVNQATT